VRGEELFLRLSEKGWRIGWRKEDRLKHSSSVRIGAGGSSRLDPSLGFPSLRYILLHSLAHAVIRQFSIECRYAAASLRERIYSSTPDEEQAMAGILIYTAAPDSEGTLGGLLTLGETANLEQHLDQALECWKYVRPIRCEQKPSRRRRSCRCMALPAILPLLA
jgi:hypothetical protein